MLRHSISTTLALCALALLLHAGTPRAQQPDAAAFGIKMEMGDISQLRKWLDGGLDPNFLADRIGTGLMIAAWYGIPDDCWVARGADATRPTTGDGADARSCRGHMPGGGSGCWRAVRARQRADALEALHYALSRSWRACELLLEHGADINARRTTARAASLWRSTKAEDLCGSFWRAARQRVRNDRGDDAPSGQ